MRESSESLTNTGSDPRGRVLQIKVNPDGTSRVVLDNGPVKTITIHCQTVTLHDLLSSDLKLIRAHLMTRHPGHFRKKKGK